MEHEFLVVNWKWEIQTIEETLWLAEKWVEDWLTNWWKENPNTFPPDPLAVVVRKRL